MQKHGRLLWLFAGILLVFAAMIVLVFMASTTRVRESITIEAGKEIPSADYFLFSSGSQAVYVTDVSNIPNHVPGIYDIEIKVRMKTHKSKLVISDTTKPEGLLRKVDLAEGEIAAAEQFFESIEDVSPVTVTYKKAPDFTKVNTQPVTLVLTDTSGNRSEYESLLRISRIKESIQVEVGSEQLDMKAFLKQGVEAEAVFFASDSLSLWRVGVYPVQLNVDGVLYDSAVEIVDTVPPFGTTVNRTGWVGDPIQAGSFVSEIIDNTAVTVEYLEKPDFNAVGDQSIKLLLTDEGENQTILASVLTLEEDLAPPKIFGAKKVTAYIGQPMSYKKGLYAVDNRDGKVGISVDSSQVNLKVEGEYPVIYSAMDSSGNKTSQKVTVVVKTRTVGMEELTKLADDVLAQITTEDMTITEKAWEIYQYVNHRVTYVGVSDKTDWMKEAHRGITKGVGDCFTYYAVSHLLLNRIGIETLSVERACIGDEASHYWHMVNFGGGWYHFDACIHKPPLISFMLTDTEVDFYSNKHRNGYYYRYDRESYPASEENPSDEILLLRKRVNEGKG